jgi:hypothetical protein
MRKSKMKAKVQMQVTPDPNWLWTSPHTHTHTHTHTRAHAENNRSRALRYVWADGMGHTALYHTNSSYWIYTLNSYTALYSIPLVVIEKNAGFWDVTSCGSCKNRRAGGTHRFHYQGDKNRQTTNNVSGVRGLLFTANVVPSSPILVTLIMEVIRSSETSVLTERQGVTSQKTALFIGTAVNTSNLTWFLLNI